MNYIKNSLIAVIFIITLSLSADAGFYDSFTLGVSGNYMIPYGEYSEIFKPGIGGGITALYNPGWEIFFVDSTLNFLLFDLKDSPNSSMQQYSLMVGPGLQFQIMSWLTPWMSFQGGISYMRFDFDQSGLRGSTLKPAGLAQVGFNLTPFEYLNMRFSAGFFISELSGKNFMGVSFAGAAIMRLSIFSARNIVDKKESLVHLSEIRLNPVFSARFAGYETRGIGIASIINRSSETLLDVRVETQLSELDSGPTASRVIKSIAPGSSVQIDLPLNINRKVLSLNETREIPVRFRTFYSTSAGVFSYIETKNLEVHPKNALTWDNTAHIGSFITPRDGVVSSFARNVISLYKNRMITGYNTKLQEALVVFDAIGAASISYAADPNQGYGRSNIDFVMFAAETLHKKAGDCDDLTVLYCSLLESLGIKTAVVTIPGHILMMLDTEVPQNSYTDIIRDESLLYFMNGTVWLPVEVTMIGKSFLEAWRTGASILKRYRSGGGSGILETSRAWAIFPPADIDSGKRVNTPSEEKIDILYNLDMDELRVKVFQEPEEKYKTLLNNDKSRYDALNRLGILKAKEGLLDDSFNYFREAIKTEPLKSPAWANLGNLYMLKRDYSNAVKMYEKAVSIDSKNHKYRIGLARAYFEAGKKYQAKVEYQTAIKGNPGYGRRYAYLDSDPSVRAADPNERVGYNMWEE